MGDDSNDAEGVAKLSAESESARLTKPWSVGEARAFVGDDRARAGWKCPGLGLWLAKMVPEPWMRVIDWGKSRSWRWASCVADTLRLYMQQ